MEKALPLPIQSHAASLFGYLIPSGKINFTTCIVVVFLLSCPFLSLKIWNLIKIGQSAMFQIHLNKIILHLYLIINLRRNKFIHLINNQFIHFDTNNKLIHIDTNNKLIYFNINNKLIHFDVNNKL